MQTLMHDLGNENQPPPIPPVLHSEYLEGPFRSCTRCGESLGDFEGGFQISKAFKRGECVFEYALCDHCRTALMEEFSEKSKSNLMRFQNEEVRFEHGLDGCAVCGVARDESPQQEFVLTGVCDGSSLLHSLMICGKCGERTQEMLSKPTKDTWRRFRSENFPGPPAGVLPEPVGVPVF